MTKEHILDTVIEMIKEGKADTISMSKIANKAEIGKSTIYEYFETKEELMNLALKRLINKYVDVFLKTPMGNNTFDSFYKHMIVAIDIKEECFQVFDISKLNNISFFANDDIMSYMQKKLIEIAKRCEEIYELGLEEGVITPKRDFSKQKYILFGLIKGSFLCNHDYGFVDNEIFIHDLYENLLVLLNN